MNRNNSTSLSLPGQILRVTAEDYEKFCGLPGIMKALLITETERKILLVYI